MKHDESHARERRRAGIKRGFCIHVVAYVATVLLLVVINYSTSSDYLWFKWPLLGWGIGLLCHGLAVFVRPRLKRQLIE